MGFGDFFLGSEGTPGEHGIDVAYIDEYDDAAAMRNNLVNYWQNMMSGNAQLPQGLQDYSNQILDYQMSNLNRSYMGDPGNRSGSAFGRAMEMGAQTGIGDKATMAQGQKVNYELEAKKAAAREAMNKYRMSWLGGQAANAPGQMQQLYMGARNPTYAASAYNIQPQAGTEGFLSKAGGALATAAGTALGGPIGGTMAGSLSSMFGNPSMPTYTSGGTPDAMGSTGNWDQGSLNNYFGQF